MIAAWLALLLALPSWQGDLERAERAYRLGQFEAAFRLYGEALAGERAHRGAFCANLGNCAFRLGRHADAVLYYRRALVHLPGDAVSAHNLALAERALGIAEPANAAAASPWAWLAAAVVLQSLGLFGWSAARGRAPRATAALVLAFGVVAALRTAQLQWSAPPACAVALTSVPLRAAAESTAAAVGALRPGTTVVVVERRGDVLRVAHAGGEAWLDAAQVAFVAEGALAR